MLTRCSHTRILLTEFECNILLTGTKKKTLVVVLTTIACLLMLLNSSATKNASDTFSESLDLKIDNISDIQPITLAKYANNSIEDLRKDFDIIKLDRNASLSHNPAYKLVYTGVEEGVNLQAMLILTIKGDKAYIIHYNAEPTKFSYYLPTLQKMINSFQITK